MRYYLKLLIGFLSPNNYTNLEKYKKDKLFIGDELVDKENSEKQIQMLKDKGFEIPLFGHEAIQVEVNHQIDIKKLISFEIGDVLVDVDGDVDMESEEIKEAQRLVNLWVERELNGKIGSYRKGFKKIRLPGAVK